MSKFSKERLMKILLAPIVSEKSVNAAESANQFAFQVASDATKPEIKAAVELLFEVDVEKVQVLNVKGKRKRFGQRMGRRADVRKAYVRLKEGQDINFGEGA
ncbi:MAG: 50S ribosomal protein L23 [Gammaproteobacteria bacterium]|nr:MAG: 50S ribosomal protein L23 [Gammaproteobacteria bacterium]